MLPQIEVTISVEFLDVDFGSSNLWIFLRENLYLELRNLIFLHPELWYQFVRIHDMITTYIYYNVFSVDQTTKGNILLSGVHRTPPMWKSVYTHRSWYSSNPLSHSNSSSQISNAFVSLVLSWCFLSLFSWSYKIQKSGCQVVELNVLYYAVLQ